VLECPVVAAAADSDGRRDAWMMAVCAAAAVPCINDGRPPAAAAAVAARLSSRRRRTSLAKFRLLYTHKILVHAYMHGADIAGARRALAPLVVKVGGENMVSAPYVLHF